MLGRASLSVFFAEILAYPLLDFFFVKAFWFIDRVEIKIVKKAVVKAERIENKRYIIHFFDRKALKQLFICIYKFK